MLNLKVLKEVENNPDEAKNVVLEVRVLIGDHLGYTDIDNKADFGETEYGDNTKRKRRLLKRLLICGIMMKDRNTPKS